MELGANCHPQLETLAVAKVYFCIKLGTSISHPGNNKIVIPLTCSLWRLLVHP